MHQSSLPAKSRPESHRAAWLAVGLGLFVLGTAGIAAAQDYMVKLWGVDDGLPESSISDVVQTRDGYIWASTLNNGLSRFDGVRFVNFDLPFAAQFTGAGVRRLFPDADGTLWINGFGNYLASYRDGKFRLELVPSVVANYLINPKPGQTAFCTKEGQLLERVPVTGGTDTWRMISVPDAGQNTRFFGDAAGDFWFRTTNGLAKRVSFDGAELNLPAPDLAMGVTALAGDAAGNIALANGAGIYVFGGREMTDLTPTNDTAEFTARGLVSDGQGGWWVETGGRLRRCRNKAWIAECPEWGAQRRSWSRVRWEQPDANGGLWLAYTEGGVVHVSAQGKLSVLTTTDGLPSNRVRTLYQDREGNVWASFERGGVARIRPRLFQAIGSREGLADSVTTSVCEDDTGAIWIGTLSGDVGRWQNGVCTNYTPPLAGTHNEMSTVFPGAAGDVWIGTHGNGLLVYRAGRFQPVLSIDQVGINIRGIFCSSDHRVWIASQDGLFCLDNGRVTRLLSPKAEANYPAALAEGAKGVIWVAMNTGELLKIDGADIETYRPADASLHRRFSSVCVDDAGAVWIGTLGAGLLRFQDGQFTAFNKASGLPFDHVSQVLDDGHGNLWLGSPSGLMSVNKKSLDGVPQHLQSHVFGRDDGLPTVSCATASQPTGWRARDGRLWFATANGVTSVMPQDPVVKLSPPLVILEEMMVDGQLMPLPAGSGPKTPSMRLNPGRHHLEFRFTGLNFAAPERLRFKYYLEGQDTTWQENQGERTAGWYTFLPGDYRFHVMACNGDGVWSQSESSVAFTVPPYFWETQWFKVAMILLIVLLAGGAVYWRLQIQHRRQLRILEQQQALERERTRIAQDIHDDLGSSLTRITMLSQSALGRNGAAKPPEEVGRIYATAAAMTRTLDEIVWAINPRHDSLDSLASYLAEFVDEFCHLTGLRFRLDMPLNLPARAISAETRHSLFLAFKEALNNVVKHARAGEVVVTMTVQDGSFTLELRDDGCGFEPGTPGGPPGSVTAMAKGNGLKNIQQRLADLGGACRIESAVGRGTCVTFIIPLAP